MYTYILGSIISIILIAKRRIAGVFLLGFCILDFLYSLSIIEVFQEIVFLLSIISLCLSMILLVIRKGEENR